MKNHSLHTDVSAPQSVTDTKISTAQETIQIGFTAQRVSSRAGMAACAGFLHWQKMPAVLSRLLPHRSSSNNASIPSDTALGFMRRVGLEPVCSRTWPHCAAIRL